MSKQRVLIIEDDTALAEVLAYNLQESGFEVVQSTDGQDGLKHAQSVSPNLILLDLMLPLVDGIEVCRRLRSEATTIQL